MTILGIYSFFTKRYLKAFAAASAARAVARKGGVNFKLVGFNQATGLVSPLRRQICLNPVWRVGSEGSRSEPERSEAERSEAAGPEPTQPTLPSFTGELGNGPTLPQHRQT